MKYVNAVIYVLGAFTWPWTAGIMMVMDDWLVVAVLLAWSFVAWWKIVEWVRMTFGVLPRAGCAESARLD